jgi:uroporphyrinogen-III synthase
VSLKGARIALLEARLSHELAALVRRFGAEPHCCPAVREEKRDCGAEVEALLDDLRREASPIFVFSTGVGVDALFAEARRLGREDELREAVRSGVAVCRGPKPTAALKRVGLGPAVSVQSPYTTEDVAAALETVDVAGRRVVLIHYGERNVPLVSSLEARAARLRELLLYQWRPPEDLGPLRALVGQIVEGQFAAVAFTSQVQARHLFQVAEEMGRAQALREILLQRVVVAAVGPTCARALAELGVQPHVVPENPKMGAMLSALAERFSRATR